MYVQQNYVSHAEMLYINVEFMPFLMHWSAKTTNCIVGLQHSDEIFKIAERAKEKHSPTPNSLSCIPDKPL